MINLRGYYASFYGEEYQDKEEKERRRIAFLGLLITRLGQSYIEGIEDERSLNNIVSSFTTLMKRAMVIASLQGEECTPNEEELEGMVIIDSLLRRLDSLHYKNKG